MSGNNQQYEKPMQRHLALTVAISIDIGDIS